MKVRFDPEDILEFAFLVVVAVCAVCATAASCHVDALPVAGVGADGSREVAGGVNKNAAPQRPAPSLRLSTGILKVELLQVHGTLRCRQVERSIAGKARLVLVCRSRRAASTAPTEPPGPAPTPTPTPTPTPGPEPTPTPTPAPPPTRPALTVGPVAMPREVAKVLPVDASRLEIDLPESGCGEGSQSVGGVKVGDSLIFLVASPMRFVGGGHCSYSAVPGGATGGAAVLLPSVSVGGGRLLVTWRIALPKGSVVGLGTINSLPSWHGTRVGPAEVWR